jgi:hypothetical protein
MAHQLQAGHGGLNGNERGGHGGRFHKKMSQEPYLGRVVKLGPARTLEAMYSPSVWHKGKGGDMLCTTKEKLADTIYWNQLW